MVRVRYHEFPDLASQIVTSPDELAQGATGGWKVVEFV
jgi:hypothetical protein